jgi:hypothetical protein
VRTKNDHLFEYSSGFILHYCIVTRIFFQQDILIIMYWFTILNKISKTIKLIAKGEDFEIDNVHHDLRIFVNRSEYHSLIKFPQGFFVYLAFYLRGILGTTLVSIHCSIALISTITTLRCRLSLWIFDQKLVLQFISEVVP